MKVLLLNDGKYDGLEGIKFPVEVQARRWNYELVLVTAKELKRVGASGADGDEYPFMFQEECTLVAL